MKKISFYAFLMLLSITFFACGGSSKEENKEEENTEENAGENTEQENTETTETPQETEEETGDPIGEVEPIGDCPEKTVITELMAKPSTTWDEAGPYDFSNFKDAFGKMSKKGDKIEIIISNIDEERKILGRTLVFPGKEKGDYQLVISLSNAKEKLTTGEYSYKGYGEPMKASVSLGVAKGEKGTYIGFNTPEGSVKILSISKDKICGTYELKSKEGSSITHTAKGEFSVPVEVSKY